MFEIASVFLVLTALLAYLNQRFIGLPITIGVMAAALLLSLALIGLDLAGIDFGLRQYEESLLRSIDFSNVLMQGMLSLLLFAGALHVDLSELRAYRWQVGLLAVLSTTLSTLAVGFGTWFALSWVGLELPLVFCLLFGALISPTDPIAVMGILKTAGAPKRLELVIAGESLFNDGVGVVIFSLLLGMLASGAMPSVGEGLLMLLHEAGGGLLFGLALGYITFRALKSVDSYQVEVLLTLAAVTGGYALASRLHVSGPLAMVVAGLIIGNGGRRLAMSDTTRHYVDLFWELIDEILNAVLFVLIGLEIMLVTFSASTLVAAVLAMSVTLAARALTVGLPVAMLPGVFRLPKGSGWVLTWGGLRGGISVALALSLPLGSERDIVLTLTYCIVVFSILCQGLTIGWVVRKAVTQQH
ncbi:cation:proton antiporter [Thiorhodovibrio frisius]|uniref:NhaP-type Na+(K+)/H+ antiporter n=1 Tax=Thiorhodovibrio frisius TaxID=631362 RepID=H8Z108_9GAMM|nr:sodium:proton antiporter [Thiorhodovibrio frisius]EIC22429.1 NhaP-type Na+(K+)/H+ antiporter [Thiorhodovibrio frisius]WPL24728.1 Sodium, potassium, lithium and rubidium/H(+) antiporter [Thiorhodovibrio frisius]